MEKVLEYTDQLLMQSEARLRRAELSSKSGNWELHLNTNVIIGSEGACKIYGVSQDAFDFEVIKKVPLAEYRSLLDMTLKNLMEKDEPYDIEFKIRAVDTYEIKDIHSVAEYDRENNILFGVIQDITQRKVTENELALYREHLEEIVKSRTSELDNANRELLKEIEKKKRMEELLHESLEKEKDLNKLRSRFVATASHEFRTPLSIIFSSAELMQRYGYKWDDEKKIECMERIKKSVNNITVLLNDLLSISRAEQGKLEFKPAPSDLYKACALVIDEIRLVYGSSVNIMMDYNTDQRIFNIDSKLIYSILQNLVSNAIKYSTESAEIKLTVYKTDTSVKILVSDTGVGITEDDLPHIFEPFHRSVNSMRVEGSGLGLTVVKHSVEIHKGNISVQSQLGKGTTFTVEIPLL